MPDQAGDAAAVLARPAAAEPGAEPEGRQLALFAGARVSTVPYAALRKLAESAIRKECRTSWNYDWDAFAADDPAWRLTEVVQRRALQDAARQGLDAAPTAVPTDTALTRYGPSSPTGRRRRNAGPRRPGSSRNRHGAARLAGTASARPGRTGTPGSTR